MAQEPNAIARVGTRGTSVKPFPYHPPPKPGFERDAFLRLDPSGFYIRHPPPPHELNTYMTPDDKLFQTIHMGAAIIDPNLYKIVIDGLVIRPYAITFSDLQHMPRSSITAFHECYGSPLKPPIEACLRVGNVTWTGVKLSHLLSLAGLPPSTDNLFVWSSGLDRGTFAGIHADRYQKDIPMTKALASEVLVAYEMNGEPLSKERGGPARLVVPGYFGTNSAKWLCRLEVRAERAPGPYTTTFYNERDPDGPSGKATRPVWGVDVNSMIVKPEPGEIVQGPGVLVEGWAWSEDGVRSVSVSGDGGINSHLTTVYPRFEFGWQRFEATLKLEPGRHCIVARATCVSGHKQPLEGRRNHVHCVEMHVKGNTFRSSSNNSTRQ
jgi:DMSO/TMAO reductase YedYZ molybdopterin-dependent catalytic subunit